MTGLTRFRVPERVGGAFRLLLNSGGAFRWGAFHVGGALLVGSAVHFGSALFAGGAFHVGGIKMLGMLSACCPPNVKIIIFAPLNTWGL